LTESWPRSAMGYTREYTDAEYDEVVIDRTNPSDRSHSRSYKYHVGKDLGLSALIQVHNRNWNEED